MDIMEVQVYVQKVMDIQGVDRIVKDGLLMVCMEKNDIFDVQHAHHGLQDYRGLQDF